MLIWKYIWLFPFLPLLTGAVFFHKLVLSHRFLYFFVVLGVITEIITKYLSFYTDLKNNMPLGHSYIALSFIFIATFYLHELKGHMNGKIIIGIIVLFEIFSIVNIIAFQSYYDYPSVTGATSALILVMFSILLFSKIMEEGKIRILSQSSLIWINSAVLIYYAGNFFFYILFNLILEYSSEFIRNTINFFKILNVLFYFLLAVGFWKAGIKRPETNDILPPHSGNLPK